MALKGNWTDKIDGIDDVLSEDINKIAHGVIDLEEKIKENEEEPNTNLDKSKFSNALKGNASGEIVAITDISPIEHTLKVKVSMLVPDIDLNDISLDNLKTPNMSALKCYLSSVDEIIAYIETSANWDGDKLLLYRQPDDYGGSERYAVYIYRGDVYTIGEEVQTAWDEEPSVTLAEWVQGLLCPGSLMHLSRDRPYITDEGLYLILGVVDGAFILPDISGTKVYAQGKNLCELGTRTFVQTDFVDLKYPIKGGVTYNVSAFITSTDTKDSVCAMAFYNGDETVCPNQQFNRQNDKSIVQIKPSKDITKIYLYAAGSWQTAAGDTATFANIMITPKGNDATYEPFIEPVEYTVGAGGTVEGVEAIYPSTTLTTDTDGVIITAEYNRDINKAFEELYNAIISIGGNV